MNADVSTAIFDGSRVRCVAGDSDEAKSILRGENSGRTAGYVYPPDVLAGLPPERREDLEKRNQILQQEADRSWVRFQKYVHRERDTVRDIARRWPTAVFEDCEIYLADPPGAAD